MLLSCVNLSTLSFLSTYFTHTHTDTHTLKCTDTHTHKHTHLIRKGRGLQLDIEHLKPSWLPCHAVGVEHSMCVCVWEWVNEWVWVGEWVRKQCHSGYWTGSLLPYFLWCHRLFHGPSSAVCVWVCMRGLPLGVICHAFHTRLCVCVCVCVCVCTHAFEPWPRPWWVPRHRGWVSLCPGFHGSCWLY